MIHYTPEGCRIKLGLNFSGTPGGFRLLWAWYDFATYTATTYRLRVRLHMAPRLMWEVKTFNVIASHMDAHGLALVHREVLEDLKAIEDDVKRTNEPLVYLKTQ